MKRLLFLLLSFVALYVSAQTAPDWYDDAMRRSSYPAGQYFIGFAEGQRTAGESLEAANKRLQDAARVEAVSSIRIHVKSQTTNSGISQTVKSNEGTFRKSIREMLSVVITETDIEIPGLKTDVYRTPSGTIAAFAYVKKATLIRQLEKQITVCLTKIETALDQIEQMIANGQKMAARDLAQETLPQFQEIDTAQNILAAVDDNADNESLQLQETRDLQHRLLQYAAQLKNGINIYLKCEASLFDSNYSTLGRELQGELSKTGCNFVSDAAQSDWALYVTATPRKYNASTYGSSTTYFCYVDVNIIVDKTTTGQRIYEDHISEKGGHTHNYNEAARDAYRYLAKKISEILLTQIKE